MVKFSFELDKTPSGNSIHSHYPEIVDNDSVFRLYDDEFGAVVRKWIIAGQTSDYIEGAKEMDYFTKC